MKVLPEKIEAARFTPIRITIELESEEEVAAFYAHFDIALMCDVLRAYGLNPAAIRDRLSLLSEATPDSVDISHRLMGVLRNE